jgi:hypothetical protein
MHIYRTSSVEEPGTFPWLVGIPLRHCVFAGLAAARPYSLDTSMDESPPNFAHSTEARSVNHFAGFPLSDKRYIHECHLITTPRHIQPLSVNSNLQNI